MSNNLIVGLLGIYSLGITVTALALFVEMKIYKMKCATQANIMTRVLIENRKLIEGAKK